MAQHEPHPYWQHVYCRLNGGVEFCLQQSGGVFLRGDDYLWRLHPLESVVYGLYVFRCKGMMIPERHGLQRATLNLYVVLHLFRRCYARKQEHVTQETLAERVGTNKSYISRIEKGLVEPGAGLFLRIMGALGLRVDIVRPV